MGKGKEAAGSCNEATEVVSIFNKGVLLASCVLPAMRTLEISSCGDTGGVENDVSATLDATVAFNVCGISAAPSLTGRGDRDEIEAHDRVD